MCESPGQNHLGRQQNQAVLATFKTLMEDVTARPFIHMLLHVLVPAAVARLAYTERWRYAWCIMLLTMVVDFDHLLAIPLYDPHRCSIGFHPLHTGMAIAVYSGMLCFARTRLAGCGLVIHMALDALDCVWMSLE